MNANVADESIEAVLMRLKDPSDVTTLFEAILTEDELGLVRRRWPVVIRLLLQSQLGIETHAGIARSTQMSPHFVGERHRHVARVELAKREKLAKALACE